jgi:hypothetical protein
MPAKLPESGVRVLLTPLVRKVFGQPLKEDPCLACCHSSKGRLRKVSLMYVRSHGSEKMIIPWITRDCKDGPTTLTLG